MSDPGTQSDEQAERILHLFADTGVEDEVLHTFGEVVRVGIDPEPNPFSTVVQGDARSPPVTGEFDLAVAHPKCQRWSVANASRGTSTQSGCFQGEPTRADLVVRDDGEEQLVNVAWDRVDPNA